MAGSLDEVKAEKVIRTKWLVLKAVLGERDQRLWAATEARGYGHGGIMVVHRATGLARVTIGEGLRELEGRREPPEDAWRQRRKGAGRKKLTETDPTLVSDLEALVSPGTRGDPMVPLLWTSKSLKTLATELCELGHRVGPTVVGELLRGRGYRLKVNRKTREGADHPDRDQQFQYINEQVGKALAGGQPCISVDTKKKELVGDFKNTGSEWKAKGETEDVRVHDFKDPKLGKAVPYGVYDLGRNQGFVSVGISHDTAGFAVETIRNWYRDLATPLYPSAKELLITADCGGSNGNRNRLWKAELQLLANATGLNITVHHFPPGTSKWNKIEHRLFCQITRNWRGKPLVNVEVILQLIANTRTAKGLTVHAKLDAGDYPAGIEVPDSIMDALNITPHTFHGDWNYTIKPQHRAPA
jgi:hypothetical protein